MEIQRKRRDGIGSMTSICFNCQNACGGCSWSELDPDTRKPRFEPVSGWTAKPVLLHIATCRKKPIVVETYHVTACPQFIPDAARKANFDSLTDEQCAELMKQLRIRGWL